MAVVDVAIVSWNGREDTLRAVASVVSQDLPGGLTESDLTITVVDNGSTDGTAEALAAKFPGVRLLRHHNNRGFTGGVTTAAQSSQAEYLILLNNDAVAEPGWLAALVDRMRSSPPDIIAAGGRILDPTGTLVDFIGGVMTFDGHGFQLGFRKPVGEIEQPREAVEQFFACGGNMIVRRAEFLESGGFDNDFFAYLEDVDFGWRSWLSGYRILFEPAATVRHKSSATSDRLGAFERGVLFERNALQTAIKNYEGEVWHDAAGSVFLTHLHRLHRYIVDRNSDTAVLKREPFGEASSATVTNHESFWRKLRRKLGLRLAGAPGGVILSDPLTIMQIRATEWFFRNLDRVVEKRVQIQKRRRRTDREIFDRFPLFVVPTYPGDPELMRSRLFEALLPPVEKRFRELDEIMKR